VHFTFTFPYGPYGLYKASVPVQGCILHSIFIPVVLETNGSIFNILNTEIHLKCI